LALMPDGETGLVSKFKLLARVLDERGRRLVAAAEAESMGFGGVTAVARASGLSRGTVIRGVAELKVAPKAVGGQRIRRQGAGRKRTVDQDASLKRDLESLVEAVTRGDPESSLRWTCKSVRQLAAELKRMKHRTSHRMVAELLHEMEYSLQANSKTLEGSAPGPGCAVSP
jgi:Rhodopirellula transposase DDE domain